jgi:hypothetical protein
LKAYHDHSRMPSTTTTGTQPSACSHARTQPMAAAQRTAKRGLDRAQARQRLPSFRSLLTGEEVQTGASWTRSSCTSRPSAATTTTAARTTILAPLLQPARRCGWRTGASWTRSSCTSRPSAATTTNSNAYNNLGNSLAAGEKVRLADGRELDKKQLFVEAIRCDNNTARVQQSWQHSCSRREGAAGGRARAGQEAAVRRGHPLRQQQQRCVQQSWQHSCSRREGAAGGRARAGQEAAVRRGHPLRQQQALRTYGLA